MKVLCQRCGDTIARFGADTSRKTSDKLKEAVCGDCSDSEEELLEKLADLEHRQWMHWSKYVAENHNIPDSLRDKWRENWESYDKLSEEMKEKDRKWAKKALAVIREKNTEGGN